MACSISHYVYFPKSRLEIGVSYGRLQEGNHSNAFGTDVWWEPAKIPLKIRSEYAHQPHTQGYWIETDYRLSQFHGPESLIGRLEPVFRLQQTFRNSPDPTDGLPAANTQRTDFGLDYHLPHEVRINTSYERQFSSTGNFNIWETGIVYRPILPAWRGKSTAPASSGQQQTNSNAGQLGQKRDGQQVFEQNCSRCHSQPPVFSPGISGTVARHMRVARD